MHLKDVVDANRLSRLFRVGFEIDQVAPLFGAQLPERHLRGGRVAVANQRRDEVAGVAVDALDNHHPDIRFPGDDVDVVRFKRTVTN